MKEASNGLAKLRGTSKCPSRVREGIANRLAIAPSTALSLVGSGRNF